MCSIGEQGRDIFNTFELTDQDKNQYNVYLTKLDEYFLPKVNCSVERNKFNMRVQVQGEPFNNFVKDLRPLASNCSFGNFKHELIKRSNCMWCVGPKSEGTSVT